MLDYSGEFIQNGINHPLLMVVDYSFMRESEFFYEIAHMVRYSNTSLLQVKQGANEKNLNNFQNIDGLLQSPSVRII